ARKRVHQRIRKRVAGTAQQPRLAVHFSGKHVYAQVIDDDAGRTLAAASTTERSLLEGKKLRANQAAAELIGKAIAERSLAKKLERVVCDRRIRWSASAPAAGVAGHRHYCRRRRASGS